MKTDDIYNDAEDLKYLKDILKQLVKKYKKKCPNTNLWDL